MQFTNLVSKADAQNQGGRKIFPKGKYKFKITEAVEKISKNGNEYISLKLAVYEKPNDKSAYIVFDNLTNHEKMSGKILHFLSAINLENLYESKNISCNQLINKSGMAILDIEKDSNNEDRNVVRDYAPTQMFVATDHLPETFVEDKEIPF